MRQQNESRSRVAVRQDKTSEPEDTTEGLRSQVRTLESKIADLESELAREKAALELRIADRLAREDVARQDLRRQVQDLAARNREIALFSRMNDFLQSSTTETEAYSIVSETATQLFPGDSGALYILSASRDLLESAAAWGAQAPVRLNFAPDECWAQRRGQVHVGLGHEQLCAHLVDDRRLHMCLPLLAQGESLGILHLVDGKVGSRQADAARTTAKRALAKNLADSIGLGIANLKLRDSMRNQSIRDPLTGLFNRRYMEESLTLEQHRTQRDAARMAVIMVDIDRFKRFNDNYGHDGGDAILRALGAFFRKHVRGSDIVCRYGGEEFILILSPSTADGARQRAEQIREGARKIRLRHANRDLGNITLSLGVAVYPDHAADTTALVKAADIALYKAKNGGRDRVVMFETEHPPIGKF